jgi:hypothetical protein
LHGNGERARVEVEAGAHKAGGLGPCGPLIVVEQGPLAKSAGRHALRF